MIKLFKHQEELLTKNPSRYLISHGTGTGKTLTSILLANQNKQSVLVICPKALKANWIRNMEKASIVPWLVVTKEEFKINLEKIGFFGAVIVDEAHAFANLKSQLSKALLRYLKKYNVGYRWLLTATPYLSSAMNIYALAKHLGYNWNWVEFDRKFFTRIRMGSRWIPKPKPNMEDEVAKLVSYIGGTVKLEDCIDLPEQVHEIEYFDLTPGQVKAIKELDEVNFIARFTYKHGIENGIYFGNEYREPVEYPCNKTERIKELVEQNDKIVIFARYNGQLDYLQRVLSDCGKPIFVINGETEDKDKVVWCAEASEKAVVLVNAMASEGYELPSFRVVVFASLDFSYKNFVQACGRVCRINNPQRNVYITLVAKGGADEDVFKAISNKQDYHVAIYDYDKERK